MSAALERWDEAAAPDRETRRRVNERLMNIAADPLRAATEDEATGIFYAKVPRTDVGLLYVPNEASHTTFVVLIG